MNKDDTSMPKLIQLRTWFLLGHRGSGAGQRVRGPTLTTKFEKWIS